MPRASLLSHDVVETVARTQKLALREDKAEDRLAAESNISLIAEVIVYRFSRVKEGPRG